MHNKRTEDVITIKLNSIEEYVNKNQNVIYNLMTVYNYLEMTAKYKELKAKVKE